MYQDGAHESVCVQTAAGLLQMPCCWESYGSLWEHQWVLKVNRAPASCLYCCSGAEKACSPHTTHPHLPPGAPASAFGSALASPAAPTSPVPSFAPGLHDKPTCAPSSAPSDTQQSSTVWPHSLHISWRHAWSSQIYHIARTGPAWDLWQHPLQ